MADLPKTHVAKIPSAEIEPGVARRPVQKADAFWEAADRLREELRASGRMFDDSTALLREDRDSR